MSISFACPFGQALTESFKVTYRQFFLSSRLILAKVRIQNYVIATSFLTLTPKSKHNITFIGSTVRLDNYDVKIRHSCVCGWSPVGGAGGQSCRVQNMVFWDMSGLIYVFQVCCVNDKNINSLYQLILWNPHFLGQLYQ